MFDFHAITEHDPLVSLNDGGNTETVINIRIANSDKLMTGILFVWKKQQPILRKVDKKKILFYVTDDRSKDQNKIIDEYSRIFCVCKNNGIRNNEKEVNHLWNDLLSDGDQLVIYLWMKLWKKGNKHVSFV